ncbi:pectinesterase family protein [Pedobacter sp. P26]|uniref:pectinesterase family protein n=1 Tax=Pedobacter sp. P26 TaxID=3423956 RepID=UPI003D670EE6
MRAIILFLLISISSAVYALDVKPDFVVAADGSGNFKTVQEAIHAVPDFRNKTTVIFIKKGIYKEKLILAASKKNVKFIGESLNETILTYDDYAQKKIFLAKKKVLRVHQAFTFMVKAFLPRTSLSKILQARWGRQ